MTFHKSRRPAGKLAARGGLARPLVHVFILSAVGLAGAAGAEKPLVWVASDVCKVNPISANVLEEHYFHRIRESKRPYYAAPSYQGKARQGEFRRRSSVWDAARKLIRLRAASNEFVAFQVIVEKGASPLKGVRVTLGDLTGPGRIPAGRAEVFVQWYMQVSAARRGTGPTYWYPDPLVPCSFKGWERLDIPEPRHGIAGQTCQAFWVDLYVPHGTAPGKYSGSVGVAADGGLSEKLKVELEVLPFELPDELSFKPELNTYNGIARMMRLRNESDEYVQAEERFQQMAHAHRQTLNIFSGQTSRRGDGQKGVVHYGAAPRLKDGIYGTGDAEVADWSLYDARMGKYLDGSAFADCPRKGVPATHCYLPMTISWPSHIDTYYSNRAIYEKRYRQILKAFETHIAGKPWKRTQFQFFLNEKRQYGAPWNMDEPTSAGDYEGHRMFGQFLIDALGPRGKRKANIVYRVDIGTYSTTKKRIDGIVELRMVNYDVNPHFFWDSGELARTKAMGDEWWYYAQDGDNQRLSRTDWAGTNNVLWGWSAWALKTTGYCKYEVTYVDREDPFGAPGLNWGYCTFFYPGDTSRHGSAAAKKRNLGYNGPIPSMKLKQLRRGSQDYEYLSLLTRLHKGDRAKADAIMARYYLLKGNYRGVIGRTKVSAADTHKLRDEAIAAILAAMGR